MPPDGKAPAPTQVAKDPAQANPSTATAAPSSAEPRYLAAGTDIRATLDTPLSTKTSKVGDRFTATVSVPVHDSTGNVIVPVGSKLNGQISEPADEKLAGAIKDMGHLNLRFTDIQLPTGADIPLSATLISIHNSKGGRTPHVSNAANPIGANAGSPGAFGPPLKGLAVGNLAGGGYVLATRAKQVELPAESVLWLRVDRRTLLP